MTESAALAETGRVARFVGRYALYEQIASGGMATVYFGRLLGPVGFSRPVAIKCLHPHHAKDPQFTKMFIDEARLASRIQHPNVVPTLDVVNADGELLLVMEYVHGESVGKLLRTAIHRKEPVPLRVALAIMTNVLHGLHAAHEAKTEAGEPLEIVHRDVSPQNVMVSIDGVARVLDFGIASAKLRLEETDEGNIKGKVSYMAPEQLAGASLDRRTDIYAAAVLLWELFCGQRLWQRADAQTSLLDKMHKPVERPSVLREDVPDALDAIVMHGLERNPDKRFATAREFALALEQYGPLAPPSEVGAWVEHLAHDDIESRSMKIKTFETQLADASVSAPAPEPERISAPADEISRPPPPQMKSDTYPVSRGSRPDKQEARKTRPSMRPSIIFEEVQKFNPWRRPVTRALIGVAIGLGAGVLGLVIRGALHGGGSGSATTTATTATGPNALGAIAPPASSKCPAGMAAIPAGKLFMGDDEGSQIDRPAHQVSVSPFCIDTTEVTVERYKDCSDRGECKRAPITNEWEGLTPADARAYDPLCTSRDPERRKLHPVNCIGWELAAAYCAANHKRLPTEAEWEYAARGSDGRKFPWGDEAPNATLLNACGKECAELGKQAHLPLEPLYAGDDGWPTTAPVGSFPRGKSRFGVEDLAGNVWEWTADVFAPYTTDAQTDPKGPAQGKLRVVRGGAWNTSTVGSLRPTMRHRDPPEKRSFTIGFRCASTP